VIEEFAKLEGLLTLACPQIESGFALEKNGIRIYKDASLDFPYKVDVQNTPLKGK